MSVINKIRIIYLVIFSIIGIITSLAVSFNGIFIPIVFIVSPLLLIFALVMTATVRCPYCGESLYNPSPGEKDMNPYYKAILFGKCNNCGR